MGGGAALTCGFKGGSYDWEGITESTAAECITGTPPISAEQEAESSAGSRAGQNPKSHPLGTLRLPESPYAPKDLTEVKTGPPSGDDVFKEGNL